jgi:tetratricopeptide (TPR) repeat protein
MKRVVVLLALITVAALAVAQTAGTQAKPPAQSGTQKAAPGQQPAAPAPPPPPVPGTKRPPEAKSAEELKAFQEVYARKAGPELESGAGEFSTKYPDSQLTVLLYRAAMYAYEAANNPDKLIEMGRKMIALDPNNPEALLGAGSTLAEKTRESDLDRDERLAEATRYLEKALQTIETDLMLPATMTIEQATAIRNQMRGQIYGGLGEVEMGKKNYAAAEKNFKQASELAGGDSRVWLRLAFVMDKQGKYKEAITPANNCIQRSSDEPVVNGLCKQELQRLNQLTATAPARPAAPTTPQPQTSVPK